jgi:hypothetical protein
MVLLNYGTTVPALQPWKVIKIQYAFRNRLYPLIPAISKIVTTAVKPINSILPQLLHFPLQLEEWNPIEIM